jgi:hypothetical protein
LPVVGPLRLIWLASLAIVPLALLWLPSNNIAYLCGVQVLAGACWAAYELAVMLIFFQEVEADERTGVVTVYNLGIAVATVAGAATGGLILRSLGETWQAYVDLDAENYAMMHPVKRISSDSPGAVSLEAQDILVSLAEEEISKIRVRMESVLEVLSPLEIRQRLLA